MQETPGNLVHLATVTSRVEALLIASALEHEGIPVWTDAAQHASVDPISVALGGHRLRIPRSEWHAASALVRELGLPERDIVYRGQQRSVLRFVALYCGTQLLLGIPAFLLGLLPALWLASVPLSALGIPVDPRGRNEFHLVSEQGT